MSDDLDDDDLGLEDAGFDNLEEKDTTLGDLWRDNPLVKVGVVGGAAIAIFATITLFGGEEKRLSPSYVPAGSEIKAPPGTEEATPAYIAAVEEENEARIEQAFLRGGSALPTPIDPPVGRLQIPDDDDDDKDPLQRWHQLQEKRIQLELQNTDTLDLGVVPDDSARIEAIQAMAENMGKQMEIVLEGTSETSVQTMGITPSAFREIAQKGALGDGNGGEGEDEGFFEDEELEGFGEQLLAAGEIVYAQLLTEANSDAPAPVLAQIVSGPFTGSRIIGDFSVEKDLLLLNFSTLILDGESIGVSGLGIDPETTLPGMATEVDHHYLQRIALPMASAFISGIASAIAESGRTTVTIQGETVAEEEEETTDEQEVATGVEEAGDTLSEIIDEFNDDIETLVRIEAGTPIGILFLAPVVSGQDG